MSIKKRLYSDLNLPLNSKCKKNQSYLCVGLDIIPELVPKKFKKNLSGYSSFLNLVIELTKTQASAYKFNLAFYESFGSKGFAMLEKLLEKIPDGINKIGDGKRGDIGSTSEAYSKAFFEHFKFDSITLNPYMGYDSLAPFFDYQDKIKYVLCLTSNKGADDFQKLVLKSNTKLYKEILKQIILWNEKHSNIGIVFGATQKDEFKTLTKKNRSLHILIPGIGRQGGDLGFTLNYMKKIGADKFLINSSRGILYSSQDEDVAVGIYNRTNNLFLTINRIMTDEKFDKN